MPSQVLYNVDWFIHNGKAGKSTRLDSQVKQVHQMKEQSFLYTCYISNFIGKSNFFDSDKEN